MVLELMPAALSVLMRPPAPFAFSPLDADEDDEEDLDDDFDVEFDVELESELDDDVDEDDVVLELVEVDEEAEKEVLPESGAGTLFSLKSLGVIKPIATLVVVL